MQPDELPSADGGQQHSPGAERIGCHVPMVNAEGISLVALCLKPDR